MSETRLSVLRPEYDRMFPQMKIRSDWMERVDSCVATIIQNRDHYESVAASINPLMPWYFPGIIHSLEATFDWGTHLHNGDSLARRTINVPAGRPAAPPANGSVYTWEESAIDALRFKEYHKSQQWDIAAQLWRLEAYNGFGYRGKNVPTPYLWSGTSWYTTGKYVADGRYDVNAKSQQVGAAAMLWMLQQKQLLEEPTLQAQTFATPGAIQLTQVAEHYQKLPHQAKALSWLQSQIPVETLSDFAEQWRQKPEPKVDVVPAQNFLNKVFKKTSNSLPETVNLPIPFFSQLDNKHRPHGTCNVTSVAMCLAFYGIKARSLQVQLEDELFNLMTTRGWDRHVHDHLVRVVKAYGCKDVFKTNASWQEVKTHLASGNPIIFSGMFTKSGHIIVLRGYDEKGFFVNDPYGEYFSHGYNTQRSGQNLHYSYALCRRVSMSGANAAWAHFLEKN